MMTAPTSAQPSMWQRSTTRRFLKWLFSWRTARRALISFAVLATLIGLFYAEEDFRGKRAWDRYRHELEARGEQLDLKAFIPKPVPDEQNFAATPLIKSWFVKGTFEDNKRRWEDNYSRAEAKVKADKTNRRFMDLVAWGMVLDGTYERTERLPRPHRFQIIDDEMEGFESGKLDLESRAKAVPSVLEGLKTNEAVFAELRVASQRPYSRYPVVYDLENPWGILLPHRGNIGAVVWRLQLKACAELAAGQSEDALEDVKLMLYMADSVKDEPTLISYLVRVACVQIAIQPIWEGLAEHAWSDAQLQELQTRLQQYDFVADMKRPLDGERAMGILTPDLIRKRGLGLLIDLTGPGTPAPSDRSMANLFGLIVPSGWYYQEQLNYCRLYQMQLEGTFDPTKKRVSPSRIESGTHEFEREIYERGTAVSKLSAIFIDHYLIAAIMLPALNRIPPKSATAQVAADQAALACALERYRLANGQFPEKLESLVPQFISQLPNDVLTGAPYRYRRTAGGQFVLYSVGWNEKDDGGVPGKTLFDEKQGDWVWTYPEK
jgi:hypothetical protein